MENEVPLVFVVHSMGGLIIKEVEISTKRVVLY